MDRRTYALGSFDTILFFRVLHQISFAQTTTNEKVKNVPISFSVTPIASFSSSSFFLFFLSASFPSSIPSAFRFFRSSSSFSALICINDLPAFGSGFEVEAGGRVKSCPDCSAFEASIPACPAIEVERESISPVCDRGEGERWETYHNKNL